MNTYQNADTSITKCFATIVGAFPDNIAIIENDRQVSYDALNCMSNIFTQVLLLKKIKKGDVVAVCMTKSIEQIAAIIAIQKIGAIYFPFSSEISSERLRYVQNETGFIVCFTNKKTDYKFSSFEEITTLEVNEILGNQPATTTFSDKHSIEIAPQDPAYIMYTSGTTGYPKGIVVPQEGVIELVKNQNYINISVDDRFLLLGAVEFDSSTFEIWGALLNGATLVLMPAGYPEIHIVERYLNQYKITILFLTTKLFNTLVENALPSLNQVKQILFGGEQASHQHVEIFMENRGKNDWLCNVYGPTECTTFSTYYEIKSPVPKIIPIGKPITGKSIWIHTIDDLLTPDAKNAGELYISGKGIFLNYMQDNSLTQAKKIMLQDQSRNTGNVFFMSGDLVKMDSRGDLIFLGRKDRMVKIRGFRIYLEEIERCIKEFHGIKEVIVLPVETKGETILVAFIVSRETVFDIDSFKSFFVERNPMYMLPNKLITIDHVPLNSHGKIDFEKLKKLLNESSQKLEQNEAPTEKTALINYLMMTWKKELELEQEQVDLDDDFFELGGHSLKLINMLNTFQKQYNFKALQQLNLVDLFKYPTIRSLSHYIEKYANTIEIKR